ncbi:hypothetical protein NIES2109_55580 (plasmid) [Nostoc sp. HK-01]|nr:hypothetical protein NIES2109_55580 [Nostoc sp. HK-01]
MLIYTSYYAGYWSNINDYFNVPSFNPVSIHVLNNLIAILEKSATYAETKKIEPSVLLNSRLYPDMYF